MLAVALVVGAARAHAQDSIPPPTELKQLLTLDDALRVFRKQGLDLLIADAATKNAEGALKIAGEVANPTLSGGVGNAFTYSNNSASQTNCYANGAQCSPWLFNVGLTDSAALVDAISGKRDLRQQVARHALAAAKMSRVDAERTIAFQVKSTYVQVARAVLASRFAADIAATEGTTLSRARERYARGASNEGDLQRIEAQKLEADQAVDSAELSLRTARYALAFLLGVRGAVPDFDVNTKVLDYSVPAGLNNVTGLDLLRLSFDHRPDLVGLGYLKQQAEAQIALVKRQRFPDVTLGASYLWGGYGGTSTNSPIQGPTLAFTISAPIPVFNTLQGEQRQAEAQVEANALQEAKVTAQVVNDVSSALAGFVAAKKLVERMEGPRRNGGGLLQSARGAYEIVATQYEKGAASLTDYLDALRTYIGTKNEYFGDLANYWTAVYQLEAAVAKDLQ